MPGLPTSLDLAATSVFLDFDGTISAGDVGVHLLERLGSPGWQAIDAEYDAGEIGSRVCLLDEWDLLPRDADLLRKVAAEVPLARWCSTIGMDFVPFDTLGEVRARLLP